MQSRLSQLSQGALAVATLFALQSPVLGAEGSGDAKWEPYRNEEGIKAYERSVQRSKFVETRAEAVVDAPLEVLLEVLRDIESYPEWMYDCVETKVLQENQSRSNVELYFVQRVPWPKDDQDAVIRAVTTVDYNAGRSVTTLRSIDNHPYDSKMSGRSRMIEFTGKFEFRMIDRNRTKMVYTAYSEPSGYAPAMIADGIIRDVTFVATHGMRVMVEKPKYVAAAARSLIKQSIDEAIEKGGLESATAASPGSP
jgi:hypothetical protein